MRSRWSRLVAAALLGSVALAGCGGQEARDAAGGPSVEVLALQAPMTEAVVALTQVVEAVSEGAGHGGHRAWVTYQESFGQVLGPISLRDVELAQEIANANTALQALMEQEQPDRAAVAQEAEVIIQGLHRAAEVMGLSLTATASAEIGEAESQERRTFTVRADEYRFDPDRLEVKAGTEVTVKLLNAGTMRHEFEIEDLDVEIEPITPGASAQVTFVVKKPGTYEFVCDIDDHEAKGMKGTLVVR